MKIASNYISWPVIIYDVQLGISPKSPTLVSFFVCATASSYFLPMGFMLEINCSMSSKQGFIIRQSGYENVLMKSNGYAN